MFSKHRRILSQYWTQVHPVRGNQKVNAPNVLLEFTALKSSAIFSGSMYRGLTEFWIILCASLASLGWVLSSFSSLKPKAYFVALPMTIVAMVILRRSSGPGPESWRTDLKKLKLRFFHILPVLFAISWFLNLLGASLYTPTHYDSLSYRIPRILYWFAEGHWHWIHTADLRLNAVAVSTEWLWAPLLFLTRNEKALTFHNLISYLLLPGLIYSYFVQLGVHKRLAWWWMWLLPSAYCYAFQAGSIATDAYVAVFTLAAINYALKARNQNNIYFLWISLLAFGFATGTKQTVAVFGAVWLFPFLLSCRLLLKMPIVSSIVLVVALCSSAMPIIILNAEHTGDWRGFEVKPVSPLWSIAGNCFALTAENLLPPIFPPAPQWNAAMDHFVTTSIGSHLSNYEKFGYLYRGPSEQWGGLGLVVCTLLFSGLFWRRRGALTRGSSERGLKIYLLVTPWLALVAFMMNMRMPQVARMLAFLYPFLFASLLYFVSCPWRSRVWRCCAYGSMLTTILFLIIARARPLFPVKLACETISHLMSPAFSRRVENSYRFYDMVRESVSLFPAKLPVDARNVGYVTGGGNLEVGLWKPFGSRRVWRFYPQDGVNLMIEHHIDYVLIDYAAVRASGVATINDWLKSHPGEIVFSKRFPLEPDLPPSEVYLVKLKKTSETAGL